MGLAGWSNGRLRYSRGLWMFLAAALACSVGCDTYEAPLCTVKAASLNQRFVGTWLQLGEDHRLKVTQLPLGQIQIDDLATPQGRPGTRYTGHMCACGKDVAYANLQLPSRESGQKQAFAILRCRFAGPDKFVADFPTAEAFRAALRSGALVGEIVEGNRAGDMARVKSTGPATRRWFESLHEEDFVEHKLVFVREGSQAVSSAKSDALPVFSPWSGKCGVPCKSVCAANEIKNERDCCVQRKQKPQPPGDMVAMAGGSYRTLVPDEGVVTPARDVTVADFSIDKTEVTVGAYRECVSHGGCEPARMAEKHEYHWCNWRLADHENHPVNCINWTNADRYCRWVNKRLPTQDEWEFAARSRARYGKRPWPGQAEPTCKEATIKIRADQLCGPTCTLPVCTPVKGTTELGLCDVVGNVSEWTADGKVQEWFETGPDGDQKSTKLPVKFVRGSNCLYEPSDSGVAGHDGHDPQNGGSLIGFRCAR